MIAKAEAVPLIATQAFDRNGLLPPSVFSPPANQPTASNVAPPRFQPHHAAFETTSQPTAGPAPDTAEDAPPKRKRRRTEKKFTRAPTGYNLFVQERLFHMKKDPTHRKYADSKVSEVSGPVPAGCCGSV